MRIPIGVALLVILQTLSPAERLAFVLHDMFDLLYAEIAPIVGRTETTAAQVATRARRRVRGKAPEPATDLARQRHLVDAFLSAARDGDFAAPLDGAVGIVVAPKGKPALVLRFGVVGDKVSEFDITADPQRVSRFSSALLDR